MSDDFDYKALEKDKADAPELYEKVIAIHESNFERAIDQMSDEQRIFAYRSFQANYTARSVLAEHDTGQLLRKLKGDDTGH